MVCAAFFDPDPRHRVASRKLTVGQEPFGIDDDELKTELERAFTGVSPEDLARLEASGPADPKPNEHGRIRGRIVSVRGDEVYVDIGGKSEAIIARDEFDEHHAPEPGQIFEFVMHGLDRESGLMRLSLRDVRPTDDVRQLKVGDVVEGRVTGVNLGGLELKVGHLRAFMPKSQVELERVEDFAHYVNRRLECEITEIDRRGRSLIVSRRRVLEKRLAEQRKELAAQLQVGQVRRGTVRRLTDFGAFVDLGGVEGLLHVSDMRYGRVKHPSEVVQVGQEIDVQILRIDPERDRISLGLKQLRSDPWELVPVNYHAGDTVEGRVTRLMNFGAFVELEEGVEGLIPISEMSWTRRVTHPKEVVAEGDAVRCVILSIDPDKRRISLSLKALGEDPWKSVAERYKPDDQVSGRVTHITDYGAFIELEEGVEGLVHVSELSDKRVRHPSSVVNVGDVVQVRVKSIDTEQRRISLTMKPTQTAATPQASSRPAKKRKRPLRGGLD